MSAWTDVSAGGGDWDMADSVFLTEGNNSSDLAVVNGGTTNENTVYLSPNGALRDTTSQLGSLTFAANNFLEMEFSISPTLAASQGNTYCFRVTDAGTPIKNYSVYPEAVLSSDIIVSTIGSQTASVDVGDTDFYIGGAFVIERPGGARTLSSITISETGTIDAQNLTNPRLYYDIDTTSPYDCAGESYADTDSFISGTAFSSDNGTTTFSLSQGLNSTATFCGYLVVDIAATSSNGETISIEILDASEDVVVTSSSVGPGSTVSILGDTVLNGSVLTQTHYHWRFDNGSESEATSASGGNQDTAISSVQQLDNRRLRLQVSNEGAVSSPSRPFMLQYGTKVSTCNAIANWITVGDSGAAFTMGQSAEIIDGNTTNITNSSLGAMTDENDIFVGVGMLRESSATTAAVSLNSTDFAEVEFVVAATEEAAYGADYCFRVIADDTPLNQYDQYPELTTRQREDFFVQRGDEEVSGSGMTLTAGVDYIAPASTSAAFVRITTFSTLEPVIQAVVQTKMPMILLLIYRISQI